MLSNLVGTWCLQVVFLNVSYSDLCGVIARCVFLMHNIEHLFLFICHPYIFTGEDLFKSFAH